MFDLVVQILRMTTSLLRPFKVIRPVSIRGYVHYDNHVVLLAMHCRVRPSGSFLVSLKGKPLLLESGNRALVMYRIDAIAREVDF
jgi:hypothetical protein